MDQVTIYKNGKKYDGNLQESGIYKIVNQNNNSYIHGRFDKQSIYGYMKFDQQSQHDRFISTIQLLKNKFLMVDFGILIKKNGDIFQGYLNASDKLGLLITKDIQYFGFISNMQYDGFGQLIMGEYKLEGNFSKGQKQGYFTIYKNDQEYIIANYIDDVIKQGNIISDIPGVLYIESNQFDGFTPKGISTIYLENKQEVICDISEIFANNEFNKDVIVNGSIITKDDNNDKFYTGQIQNFQMQGLGILKNRGFIKYEGYFEKGKINGYGKMYLKNEILIGNFVNGINEGPTIQIKDNNIFFSFYINGRFNNQIQLDINELDLNQFEDK